MRSLIERVFERLLIESSQGNSYGTCVYVKYEGVTRTAIAYDADKLVSLLAGESEIASSHLESCIIDCTLGTIMIRETPKIKGPCAGAWEVIGSAGRGYGKLVYAMGYFMSPTGRLIPDRSSLTQDAILAWATVNRSAGIPLDDKTHPDSGREPFHDLYHTEDPSDDCLIYNTGAPGEIKSRNVRGVDRLDPVYVDAVNRAYAMGTMGYDVKGMVASHERFLSEFLAQRLASETMTNINQIFNSAGIKFFDKHYD